MTKREYIKVKQLSERLMGKSKDIKHNLAHTQRVRLLSHKIVDILELKSIDRYVLDSACLLHDVTYIIFTNNPFTYIFEGILAKILLIIYMKGIVISDKEKKVIIEAVSKHTHSFPFKRLNKKGSVYTKILQDADTIDFFAKERLRDVKRFYPKNLYNKVKIYLGERLLMWGEGRIDKYLNYPELKDLLRV